MFHIYKYNNCLDIRFSKCDRQIIYTDTILFDGILFEWRNERLLYMLCIEYISNKWLNIFFILICYILRPFNDILYKTRSRLVLLYYILYSYANNFFSSLKFHQQCHICFYSSYLHVMLHIVICVFITIYTYTKHGPIWFIYYRVHVYYIYNIIYYIINSPINSSYL